MTNDPTFSDPLGVSHDRLRRLVAWLVIWGCTAIVAVRVYQSYKHPPAESGDVSKRHSVQLEISARYTVGAKEYLAGVSSDAVKSLEAATENLKTVAPLAADKVRMVAVVGEMFGGPAAIQRLDALAPQLADPGLLDDAQVLRQIYSREAASLSTEQRSNLISRHGWFGRLALGFEAARNDPNRIAAISAAKKSFLAAWVFVVIVGLAGVCGFILFIIAMVRLADGKVKRAYQRAAGPSTPFLEGFALWLGSYLLVSYIARKLSPDVLQHAWVYLLAMLIPPLLGIIWPLLRGVDGATWKAGLGWHTGRGVFREIGCGLLGYVIGLPVAVVGFIIMFALNLLSKASPTHPIIEEMAGSARMLAAAFVLACIYAPIVEETMFRGAFFSSLRARHGWLLSAIITSFIFAAIHPQGWTVVPVLFSLAFVFAGIREWRGTILASAAAHALNNGMMLTFLCFLLRG